MGNVGLRQSRPRIFYHFWSWFVEYMQGVVGGVVGVCLPLSPPIKAALVYDVVTPLKIISSLSALLFFF
jgi:hypothetical protein